MTPLVLSVGQPHPCISKRLPLGDGMVAGTLDGMPALIVAMVQPAEAEIEAVSHGPLHFGLLPLAPWGYVWLLASGAGEVEAPFCPMLDPPDRRDLTPPAAGQEWMMVQVHLVDGITGVVLALRALGVPPRFTGALRVVHDACLMNQDSFGQGRWNATVDDFRRRYASPRDALDRAMATCTIPGPGRDA